MISLAEIKKQYPGIEGFDRGILREYLQYKVLDIIFRSEMAGKLSFLGGTAIKLCYGSARFSEDLDFDNFGLTETEFEKLSLVIKRELEYEGYGVEIKNIFKGAFSCHIKIPKILFDNNLSNLEGEKILIKVDTAPHGFVYHPSNYLLQKFDVFRNIRLTPIDIILSMKIVAIFGRKRMKGRDFYDTVFLLGQSDFNYDYLKQKLNIENSNDLKYRLFDAIKDLDMKEMARDVLPFLLKLSDQERILSFREYIEQRLK